MTTALAVLALAGVALTDAARSGSARLRTVVGSHPASDAAVGVRPGWIAVGGLALGGAGWAATGTPAAGVVAAAVGWGLGVLARRVAARPAGTDDPTDLAAAWTQLAVCLEVGLPVAVATAAAAEPLPGRAGTELRRVAGLLELGADPEQAWGAAGRLPPLAAFARVAGRSAATGAALARAARAEAARLQAASTDLAEARAQRVAVLVTAPLGLCFLPAFLVLGIVPVVIGLAERTVTWW